VFDFVEEALDYIPLGIEHESLARFTLRLAFGGMTGMIARSLVHR
jgi:hypothetical protein